VFLFNTSNTQEPLSTDIPYTVYSAEDKIAKYTGENRLKRLKVINTSSKNTNLFHAITASDLYLYL